MRGGTYLGLFFAVMSVSGCYKTVTVYPPDLSGVLEEANAREDGPVRGYDEANHPVVATGPVQGVSALVEGEPEPVNVPSLSAVRIDHVGATETHMLTLASEGAQRTIPLAKLDRLDVQYRDAALYTASGILLSGAAAIVVGTFGYLIAYGVQIEDPTTVAFAAPFCLVGVGALATGIVIVAKGSTTKIVPALGAKPKSAFVELGPGGVRGAF